MSAKVDLHCEAWCEVHHDREESGGWCSAERNASDAGSVRLHNGSVSGETEVSVFLDTPRPSLGGFDMTYPQAVALARALGEVAALGWSGRAQPAAGGAQ